MHIPESCSQSRRSSLLIFNPIPMRPERIESVRMRKKLQFGQSARCCFSGIVQCQFHFQKFLNFFSSKFLSFFLYSFFFWNTEGNFELFELTLVTRAKTAWDIIRVHIVLLWLPLIRSVPYTNDSVLFLWNKNMFWVPEFHLMVHWLDI